MKSVGLALAGMLVMSGVAFAQRGTAVIDLDSGTRARIGAGCSLTIDGRDATGGKCNIARNGSVTVVDTGDVDYVIARSSRYSAAFKTRTGRFIDSVSTTEGSSCWRGQRVLFCAE